MTDMANLKPLLEEYGELKSQAKLIEARIKELDKQVRPAIEGQGNVVVGRFMFSCKMNQGRKSLDKKAMLADGIDVEAYEKVGAPFTTLTMKEIENVG